MKNDEETNAVDFMYNGAQMDDRKISLTRVFNKEIAHRLTKHSIFHDSQDTISRCLFVEVLVKC